MKIHTRQENGTYFVPLSKGRTALVDEADIDRVTKLSWSVLRGKYAQARHGKKIITLHRFIMDPPPGMEVDHLNGDGFDNRRCNLRICTHAENLQNQKPRAGKYKGVSQPKQSKKWKATIFSGGKPIHLGYHPTPEQAAQAYDRAAVQHFGPFARLNFPHLQPRPFAPRSLNRL